MTVSGNTVAAGSTSGGGAFDISTGKTLWAPKSTDSCYDSGYGGGPKLVAVRKCGEYGSARQLHIQTIDPTSGKVVSEYKMSPGIEYASVVSTDPLVVAADVGDSAGDGSGISDFFSIDNKTGTLRTKISAPGKTYAAKLRRHHPHRVLQRARRRQRQAVHPHRGARRLRRLQPDQRDRRLRPGHRQADRPARRRR